MGKESYRDGEWRVQRKAVWNQNQSLPRTDAGKRWEALQSKSHLRGVKWGSNGPSWDLLPLNPSRNCIGSSRALPPSQDVKWKGVDLARGAAELACVCGPSGFFLAHAGKGSYLFSLFDWWFSNIRFYFLWTLHDLMELGWSKELCFCRR